MSRVSILVADDDAGMRALLTNVIREHFHVRLSLSNGRQLFDAAVTGKVDVVVTEVSMPVLTGIEAMHALRLTGRSVPFVLVSGYSDIAAECLASGAEAFVSKLDISTDLIPAVRAALERRTYLSTTARAVCDLQLEDRE